GAAGFGNTGLHDGVGLAGSTICCARCSCNFLFQQFAGMTGLAPIGKYGCTALRMVSKCTGIGLELVAVAFVAGVFLVLADYVALDYGCGSLLIHMGGGEGTEPAGVMIKGCG